MRGVELRNKLLEGEIKVLEKEYVGKGEVHGMLVEVAEMVNVGLEEWVQWVGVEFRDGAVVKKAKGLRDRLRLWLGERVGDSGE